MKRRGWFFAILLLLPVLAGCNTTALTAANLMDFNPLDFFSDPVNMREKNYATADYLISRAQNYVHVGDKIKAMPLLDVQEPRFVTSLGKQIPEQIGERLIELGYKVDLSEVNTDANPAFAPTPQPVTNAPEFILSGSYIRKPNATLDLRIYLKDSRTGFERASFEYTLERTGQIRKDSTPKATIYRTN